MSAPFNKDTLIDGFILKLKRRQIVGSGRSALETAHLLRVLISQVRWQTADQLLTMLREAGSLLIKASRIELAVGNIVRRVLRLIREEYKSIPAERSDVEEDTRSSGSSTDDSDEELSDSSDSTDNGNGGKGGRNLNGHEEGIGNGKQNSKSASRQTHKHKSHHKSDKNQEKQPQRDSPFLNVADSIDSSMYNLLAHAAVASDRESHSYNVSKYSLKPLVIQGINELIDELENSRSNIAAQSLEHIQNGECIMTIGQSKTVEEFLIAAARKRNFSVLVAETAPMYDGHILASHLAKAGIETTIIPESSIDAMMGRVNKVILGCHSVMANGGLIAVTGSQLLATCASHHYTPVVVVTGIYKLSPAYPSDKDFLYGLVSPASIAPFDSEAISNITYLSPYYDYVDPTFVNLFITNVGGHPPTYLYRLLGEFYDASDDDLGEKYL